MHILLALIVMLGGPLQLIPAIRASASNFHRWNGRIYIPGVIVASLVGLYMIWTRGSAGSTIQHIGISIDGILIMVFAALILRCAMAGKIAIHRRWALRLFIVASDVWFFRVGFSMDHTQQWACWIRSRDFY